MFAEGTSRSLNRTQTREVDVDHDAGFREAEVEKVTFVYQCAHTNSLRGIAWSHTVTVTPKETEMLRHLIVCACALLAAGGFVTRQGTHLLLDGAEFRFVGTNAYWLGLDENVGGVHYPTKFRVTDALETAAGLGWRVVRAHTLGISTGNALSFEPSLGVFNASALDSADWAIAEATRLGLKLIVPLTDNW